MSDISSNWDFASRQFRWDRLRSPEFAQLDSRRTVAVLPLGATEQHGPHLPLQVDSVLVEAMWAAACKRLEATDPVLCLPVQRVGYSVEHTAFPGTLSLTPETALAVWLQMAEGVARAGVRKLLIFNAHGGHAGLMEVAAREMRARFGLLVFFTHWYQLPLGASIDAFSAQEQRFGVHAGEVETSLMLALAPETVAMDEAAHFHSRAQARAQTCPILGDGKSARMGWHVQDYHPSGAVGNAAQADASRGAALCEAAGQALAQMLRELIALPLTTLADADDHA